MFWSTKNQKAMQNWDEPDINFALIIKRIQQKNYGWNFDYLFFLDQSY